MELSGFEKQMFSTNRKQKIFNVRKLPYKQYDNEKFLKQNFSPFQKKQQSYQPTPLHSQKKATELNFAKGLSSNAYKELIKKYQQLKEQQVLERQKKIQKLKQKQEQLNKYKTERQRLIGEKQKLFQKRNQLKIKLQQIRQKNESLRSQQMQRNQEYRALNMEYLRNMIMAMRFQNGVQIDPDNMTYEELLQLQEKMGNVSKGFNQQQYLQIERVEASKENETELCSICYQNIKQCEMINRLPCHHIFHCDCVKHWLMKERVCPLCKQEIFVTNGKQAQ